MSVRLLLLGVPEIALGGERLPVAAERLYQLAVFLNVQGDWQPRDRLAALFWPDSDGTSARRNLRKLLFRATRLLPEIEARSDALRMRVGSDLRDFESACQAKQWQFAFDLYRGAFADGLELNAPEPFGEWVRFERDRLAAFFRTAVTALLGASDSSEHRAVLARRWFDLEPLDEDAIVHLIDALRACGRNAEAQRLLAAYAEQLAADLGVEPSARVRALTEQTTTAAPATPSAAAPQASTAPRRSTAPAAEQGFIGRRAELLDLKALIDRDECRVLTITGPGGIGKSRLARVAHAQLASRFESTAWIGLDDLTDVAQVAPRIASLLGITLTGSKEPLVQVIDKLSERHMLLLADNAEHLAGFAHLTARLLEGCPRLKIIPTSRARLAIDGEWLLPLAGLPVPDADETEPELLRRFDAVRLFESRAQAAAPTFDVAANTTEIVALVRALDGAPLAIELAAAGVRLLPIEAIRREIAESLDLFEAGGSTPERQRSVRASFEHSWRLLGRNEQQALARLSIFAAPFTREAASQVTEVKLPVLAALVDKSLLRADGQGWFSFHALMQQCAREKLAEAASTRARHMTYFARTLSASHAAAPSAGPDLRRIERQLEDYRQAWRTACEQRDHEVLEKMARSLAQAFGMLGRFAEGIALFGSALDAKNSPAGARQEDWPPITTATLEHALGTLMYRAGHLPSAALALKRAIERLRRLREPALLRSCTFRLGMTLWARGDPRAARKELERALKLAQDGGDDLATAQSLNGLSLCARRSGDLDHARDLLERGLTALRRVGDPLSEAHLLHDLSMLQSIQARMHKLGIRGAAPCTYDEASQTLQRALAICERHALADTRSFCLVSLANVAIERGALDAAEQHLLQSRQHDHEEGVVTAYAHVTFSRLHLRRGDLDAARQVLQKALRLQQASDSEAAQLVVLASCAEWLAARGDHERAASWYARIAVDPRAEQIERLEARAELSRLPLATEQHPAAGASAAKADLPHLIELALADLSQ